MVLTLFRFAKFDKDCSEEQARDPISYKCVSKEQAAVSQTSLEKAIIDNQDPNHNYTVPEELLRHYNNLKAMIAWIKSKKGQFYGLDLRMFTRNYRALYTTEDIKVLFFVV